MFLEKSKMLNCILNELPQYQIFVQIASSFLNIVLYKSVIIGSENFQRVSNLEIFSFLPFLYHLTLILKST